MPPLDSALGGSPTETRLALGTPVTFTSVLERKESIPDEGGWFFNVHKTWHPVERHGEGIVIGYRTLANGYTDNNGDDGLEWKQTGTVPCVLVAFHLYRKPAFVPRNAVRAVASSSQETPNG